MEYMNILITGASGRVGKLLSSQLGRRNISTPSKAEMDITDKNSVLSYFEKNKIEAVIHCAAMTDGRECEKYPELAIKINIEGTANVVQGALRSKARMIYLSTDYVYPCVKGPYSENDEAGPFTAYGWTKLGGEIAVRMIENHCIIRTSLFDPKKITFDDAPNDSYVSKISYDEIVKAIIFLMDNDFKGVVNVGQDRISLFDLYKKYKLDIKPVSINDIPKEQQRAVDSSLDVSLWKNLSKGEIK